MTRKTVSLDVDVYRQIKGLQTPHESLSATLRRVLEAEKDPADYLDELFRDFGGKGLMTDEGFSRVRQRLKDRPRSSRPERKPNRGHAA
jgi:predicted CopG family antitoxin